MGQRPTPLPIPARACGLPRRAEEEGGERGLEKSIRGLHSFKREDARACTECVQGTGRIAPDHAGEGGPSSPTASPLPGVWSLRSRPLPKSAAGCAALESRGRARPLLSFGERREAAAAVGQPARRPRLQRRRPASPRPSVSSWRRASPTRGRGAGSPHGRSPRTTGCRWAACAALAAGAAVGPLATPRMSPSAAGSAAWRPSAAAAARLAHAPGAAGRRWTPRCGRRLRAQ
mmetsp:Transcript_98218/g.305794  ORF Transcript_98218/g.305794 Transcript_98218/m.305794 type:complete len:232 (+) Transcript_98218:162-857(+)